MSKNVKILKTLRKLNKKGIYPDIVDLHKKLGNKITGSDILVLQQNQYIVAVDSNFGFSITPQGEEFLRVRKKKFPLWEIISALVGLLGILIALKQMQVF